MPTVEEQIYTIWSGDATATALVAADHFKPVGTWQNITTPYVIHFPVSEDPIRSHIEGAASLRIWLWQFSVYAASASQARTILNKLRSLFNGNTSGFNFHHRSERFVDELPDKTVLMYATEFLISAP